MSNPDSRQEQLILTKGELCRTPGVLPFFATVGTCTRMEYSRAFYKFVVEVDTI